MWLHFSNGQKKRSGITVLNVECPLILHTAVKEVRIIPAAFVCHAETWRRSVFARSSTIRHKASGVKIQTPLLVPSFSSKGFARSQKDEKSEIGKILAFAADFLTETFLISAYDVYYGHIPTPRELPVIPELIFLDSGGYEISTDSDYSSVIDPLPAPYKWDLSKLQSVLSSWPNECPLVIVSYDHHQERRSVDEQIINARKLFINYPQHLHLLLLKPATDTQNLLDTVLKSVIADIEQLGSFDIVGVTEKELGHSMLDRMVQIARLRKAMDDADVQIPIHVFGSLDPISVCLYYISGAELFDGLTWIRYGYDDFGRCVYTHNLGVLKYGINVHDNLVKTRAISENYYCLQDLQRRLREFEATKKWEKLSPHEKLIESACDSLATRLSRRT